MAQSAQIIEVLKFFRKLVYEAFGLYRSLDTLVHQLLLTPICVWEIWHTRAGLLVQIVLQSLYW